LRAEDGHEVLVADVLARRVDTGADRGGQEADAGARQVARPVAELPLSGGCLCGGVRFEIDESLVSAGWCHCTRCRRRTGSSASPQARIAPGSLRLRRGAAARL